MSDQITADENDPEFDDDQGYGFFECRGCGGDLCVCICGGEMECMGCGDCREPLADDGAEGVR